MNLVEEQTRATRGAEKTGMTRKKECHPALANGLGFPNGGSEIGCDGCATDHQAIHR